MNIKKEFHINDYISLRLENDKTNLYIKGKLFRQCKHLLLKEIRLGEIEDYIKEFKSIDEEATKIKDSQNLNDDRSISSEIEFWAHCSNLQVWAENDYDTKLLQSFLSFALLKKLNEVGDIKANRVFREEIAKRFLSCYTPVMCFLIYEGYLDFLTKEETRDLLKEIKKKDYLIYLFCTPLLLSENYISHSKKRVKKLIEKLDFFLENDCFAKLELKEPEIEDFINSINYIKWKKNLF